VFISPLARRLAHEAGLDYTELEGSGPRGRIRRRDVETAIADGDGPQATPAEHPAPTPDEAPRSAHGSAPQPPSTERPKTRSIAGEGFTDVPHSRLRRTVASRLAESKRTVPHFYVRGTANVGALVGLREELNAVTSAKVSFNDLLLKAAAVAHREHPEMNVIWTDDAVRGFDQVDISVAVASERGLVTPVLRGVDSMTVTQVAGAVRDLVERANTGKLKQEELEGGCLSLSNLGMYGTEEFSAIINPPQAAILAVGAVREEPVVRDGLLEVGQVLRFVLSVDHRPVDGAVAAAWMRTFLAVVESPLRILA
jgi:pyruvate dehydrogenase E2 component (dihydrolipoamide acetyltransferase)